MRLWARDGANWLLQNPPHRPPVGNVQSMAYEPTLGVVVLRTRPTFLAETMETWIWTGTDWLRLDTPTRVNAVSGIQVIAAPGRVFAHDTDHLYALTPRPPVVTNHGTGCPSAALRLVADTWPRPGTSDLALSTSGHAANAPLLFVVGTATTALPIGTCTLLVQAGGPLVPAVADAHGLGSLPVPLAPAPALVGLRTFAQVWSLEPNGLAATNRVDATIGQ